MKAGATDADLPGRAVFQLLTKTGYQRREGVEMKYPDYLSLSPFISCQGFPLAEPTQNPERQQTSRLSRAEKRVSCKYQHNDQEPLESKRRQKTIESLPGYLQILK